MGMGMEAAVIDPTDNPRMMPYWDGWTTMKMMQTLIRLDLVILKISLICLLFFRIQVFLFCRVFFFCIFVHSFIHFLCNLDYAAAKRNSDSRVRPHSPSRGKGHEDVPSQRTNRSRSRSPSTGSRLPMPRQDELGSISPTHRLKQNGNGDINKLGFQNITDEDDTAWMYRRNGPENEGIRGRALFHDESAALGRSAGSSLHPSLRNPSVGQVSNSRRTTLSQLEAREKLAAKSRSRLSAADPTSKARRVMNYAKPVSEDDYS